MIRLYFDLDELKAAGGVVDRSPNGLFANVRLPDGFTIALPEDNDPCLEMPDDLLFAEVPKRLDKKLIKKFTCYVNISTAARQIGEYQYKRARGNVVPGAGKGNWEYQFRYVSTNLEDMKELHRLICEGQIWPVGDHGAKMSPSPARHVRQLLAEIWEITCRDVRTKFYQLRRMT